MSFWEKLKRLYRIEHANLPVGEQVRGRFAWIAYGYVLSQLNFLNKISEAVKKDN